MSLFYFRPYPRGHLLMDILSVILEGRNGINNGLPFLVRHRLETVCAYTWIMLRMMPRLFTIYRVSLIIIKQMVWNPTARLGFSPFTADLFAFYWISLSMKPINISHILVGVPNVFIIAHLY